MKRFLQFLLFIVCFIIEFRLYAQLNNNCSNAIQVCNNQLAEQLDDGPGTQECPTGGCGCMLAGEKNTRWFKIVIQTAGTLEFTIRPYNGTADYDFSLWNMGVGGTCPTGSALGLPDRCNFAAPKSPTGIRGTTNGNSNGASGNLFSNNMNVTAGQVLYLLVDNYDGTQEGFYLDFFGGAPGSGTGTTATFSCSGVNQCTTCNDADCKSYYFASPDDYSFDETAANGACHSNFGYATVKTATVCGNFTVPAPFTTVQFPINRGYEIVTTNGANTTTCLNSAVITYQVWDNCASAVLTPSSPGIYNGLNNSTSYKVCKTITVTGANCWLSRICLPYWTMVQNDVICNAADLTMNAAPVAGTNAGASSDLDAGCSGYQDVYYKFTAPASGRVQVNVVPSVSSDVKISLIGPMAGLEGGVDDCNLSCSQLGESNVVMGCNDDAGTGGTERLFTFVIPGQTYYVWVSGTLFRPTATFTVQVTETITNSANPTPGPDLVGTPDVIPSNDQCASAVSLNLCVGQAGTTIGATAECSDPDPFYVDALTLENDVWYKWTAPANNNNSEVTLTVTGVSCTSGEDGSTGIQFGIFSGSCASLTPISHGTTSLTFTPVAGQTYYFVIDGNAGAQCNFNIQVKRPYISAQTCNTSSTCAGGALNATMGITYYGSNPGTRWAYCKSGSFGSPCTINLDNPATYDVYNPGQGLPNPGCTPATYTFVGYILADNGVTTIASGYPAPQPATANCARSTNACTFNIYPSITSTYTISGMPCSQNITINPGCASAVTTSGTLNQGPMATGTSGAYTPVTISWAAPYNMGIPAGCGNVTVNNTYNCPSPSSDNCTNALPLTIGAAPIATNNTSAAYNAVEDFSYSNCDNYGKGVWFYFTAPLSGNVDVNVTSVGVGNDFDPVVYIFEGVDTIDIFGTIYLDGDDCASCMEFTNTNSNLDTRAIDCADNNGSGGNEIINLRHLTPGNRYYVLVDGYETTGSTQTGNFSMDVDSIGPNVSPPSNDKCFSATDISNIACNGYQSMNVDATSPCDEDPVFPDATTENTVWYIYVAPYTGSYTFSYFDSKGLECAGHAAIGDNRVTPNIPASADVGAPGIQFTIYQGNTCSSLATVPNSTVSTGTFDGSVTVNLTAGQKYYVAVDGFAGNECTYKFKIYNRQVCCNTDLGVTEKGDTVLCYGEQTTLGVSADPILFGSNVLSNPVIGWQFSSTQPTGASLDPFDASNSGKGYYVGQIDRNCSGTSTRIIDQYASDVLDEQDIGTLDGTITKNLVVSGFPAGATLQNANNIELCFYFFAENMDNMYIRLRAPNGTTIVLADNDCGTRDGAWSVCLNQSAGSAITASCPASTSPPSTLSGNYTPENSFAGLVGVPLNGTWQLLFSDNYADFNGIWYYGSTLKLTYDQTYSNCTFNAHHGDLTIINNDPFKYGPQQFWLTPVTMVDYDATTGILTPDYTCYSYGAPVKITMLEKVTTPTFTPTCAAPGDGTNGVLLTVTSPTGGLPGLPGPPETYTGTNSTAASGWDYGTNMGSGGSCTPGAGMDAERTITVPAAAFTGTPTLATVNDIKVCVTLNHEWMQDVEMYLVAPNGTCIQLMTDVGPSSIASLTNVCFVASGTNISTYTTGNLSGVDRVPEGALSTLLGTQLEGIWKLQIFDDAAGDAGTLSNWNITLNNTSVPSTDTFTVIGTGAAGSISYPTRPVGESEVSSPFTVADGQAWNVRFVDNAGCESQIGGTYNKPNLGTVLLDTNVCDSSIVAFSTSNPIPLFSQYKVMLDFDSYPQDVSWLIYDGNNQVVASGGGYGPTVGASTTTTPATINPNDGPFRFVLYDGYDDGFGSGGGSVNNGGMNTLNFIRIVEVHADGTVDTLFSNNYAFCSSLYCVGPAASVFGQLDVNLGTPNGTFATGVSVTLENNRTCTGATVAGAVTVNSDGTGTINTNAAGVNPGASYSLQYSYIDQYGCVKTICGPLDVFPRIRISPTINCAASPPTVSVNPNCTGCNATYVAEYSYNGGATWTTATTANFQDIFTFAHIKNVSTGVVGCEVSSAKLADCPTVLPIELIYIKALPIDDEYIKVSWATASELNTKTFEVLRSTDAIHFTKIGELPAAGNSNAIKNYAFDDHDVSPGLIYYYQVREVDLDNSSQLTNIVNARIDKDKFELISIYPNPVSDNTVITTYSKEPADITLTIYNDIGQLMKNEIKTMKAGLNEWKIETQQWAKGVYYFIVTNEQQPVTRQVIKLE
ncbi:MAG: proprotein convertase P-domain-containing protein [Sphingobacteriales bacterium]|nr:proprotein convertase P-domain-containing protein [Sphingobacteriales bacterium]